jgi:hypothetical protein
MTRYATLTTTTAAIAPNGHGIDLPAGRYQIADLDGVAPTLLYLRGPDDALLGCIQAANAQITEE